jgi:hypothetical protein
MNPKVTLLCVRHLHRLFVQLGDTAEGDVLDFKLNPRILAQALDKDLETA